MSRQPDAHAPPPHKRHDPSLQRPLSFAQERLWFIEQLEPNTSVYNVPIALRITGQLDRHALQLALDAIVERHAILRTSYHEEKGIPFQFIHSASPVDLEFSDVRACTRERGEIEVQRRLSHEAAKPLNLQDGKMLRSVILQVDELEHILLLISHHIATDGWSTNVLLQELSAFYDMATQGEAPSLSPLLLQYWEYAVRQRSHPDDDLAKDYDYWTQQLADAPAQLAMPLDRARTRLPSHEGARLSTHIPASLANRLRTIARHNGATPFMILLAVYFVVLARYTKQDDICVGIPIAGRTSLDVEPLVGLFVNMLVIRERLCGDMPFVGFLHAVRNTCLDAYDHQNLPFERLVARLQPQRVRNRTPLFQTSFSLQSQPASALRLHELDVERMDVEIDSSKFDLNVVVRESGDGFDVHLTYPCQLFDQGSIQRLLDHFLHACGDVCAHPTQSLDQIQLAPLQKPQPPLKSASSSMTTPQSISEAFADVARRSPNAVALQFGDQSMTYERLRQTSDRLASYLIESGVSVGSRIGIYLEPSLDNVVSILAVVRAGAGYVPLDPSVPSRRTAQLIDEADLLAVLTQTHLLPELPDTTQRICLDALDTATQGGSNVPQTYPHIQPSDLAYVMFTSGSTGKPKGVLVPHRGVLRLVKDADYATLDEDTRLLHLSSPAFDASTFEVWGPLLNGGVCVLSSCRVPSISQFANLILENGINTMWLTSSWFNTIIDEDATILSPLRQLLVGGERLSVPHVIRALEVLPHTRLINGYGPTENTTFSCTYTVPHTLDPTVSSIPIGRPIQDDIVHILDDRLQPTAPGVPGELFVGGDGLALGYLTDTRLTTERFVPDPFRPNANNVLYRTGDRVRLLPSGDLEFLGRIDRQLKIRGFRVEPGEIEHVLMQHPAVSQVHVAVGKDAGSSSAPLIAYVRPAADNQFEASDLRQFVSMQLPDYMLPAAFIPVSELPLNAAGKIDESLLSESLDGETEARSFPTRPTTETQRRITALWQTILDREQVGIEDNFFEIGGHSLLAVRLIAKLESEFDISLPLAVLFDAPTVASLASRIESLASTSSRSTILPIRSASHMPPFVCVPPGGSSVYHFSDLARYLPSSISMFGAQPVGVESGEVPHRSVEDMASRYVADLQRTQPRGPYYLGGRCFGAFVAFEMAQQLVRQGYEVGLLVLMDPSAPPGMSRDAKYYAGRISYFKRRGQLAHAVVRHVRARVRQLRRLWLRSILASAQERRMARMQRAHRQAQFTYTPNPYPGDVVFLGAKEDYDPEDPRALWKLLARGTFALRLVPGDHRSMTQEPHIRTFAEELGNIVIEAQQHRHAANPPPQ